MTGPCRRQLVATQRERPRGYRRAQSKRTEENALNDDELTARLEAAHAAARQRHGVEPTEDTRSLVAELRALRRETGDDHPLRVPVAVLLGPQLTMDALAEPGCPTEVLDEAVGELALALAHVDDVELRHHHAVALALRFTLHSGPDEDHDTAHAEFTDLLETPGYPEPAHDLARIMLVQLGCAKTLGPERRRYPVRLDDAVVAEFVGDAPTAASIAASIAEVNRHLSHLSEKAKADNGIRATALLFETIPALFAKDQPAVLDEAIARLREETGVAEDEFGQALLATLLAGLLDRKAQGGNSREDTDAVRAAAREVRSLVRDDMPLAPLLRDAATLLSATNDRSAASPDQLADELEEVRAVLRRLPASDPARAEIFTRSVMALAYRVGESGDPSGMAQLRAFVAAEGPGAADESALLLVGGMVDVLEGVLSERPESLNSGMARLEEATRVLPRTHRVYPLAESFIAMALSQRAISGRSLEDLDSARRLLAAQRRDDTSQAGTKLSELTVALSAMRHGTPTGEKLDEIIEMVRGLDEHEKRFADFDVDELVGTLEYMRLVSQSYGRQVPAWVPPPTPATGFWADRNGDLIEAMTLVHNGYASGDLAMLDRGVELLRGQPVPNPSERVRVLMVTALSIMFRYARSARTADLDAAIAEMEQAAPLLDEVDLSDASSVHYFLGEALHLRGNRRHDSADLGRAAEHGLLAMRGRANEVLLQSKADHALATAETAAGEAAKVVRWCVGARRYDAAVQALELGRSLVLHSVGVEPSIPDLLRSAGEAGLAERWLAENGVENPGLVPSDLRSQVLVALEGTRSESALLRPPAIEDVHTALRRTGSRALVYLLPPESGQNGFALVVEEGAEVRLLALPHLRSGPVEEFEAARRLLVDPSAEDEQRWRDAVALTCGWSWTAVMGPLLEEFRGLQRLVLVPVGELGAVPWHAARREVGGTTRYACQDAVVTYAASARQFVDAARRERRPVESAPALVRVRDSELDWAAAETATVRDHAYPDATCVEDGVRAADVLGHLPSELRPGASVLHLTCHACHATPAVDSHLVLDDGEVLPVRDVLRQAAGRPPDAEGGLVVLASCASDLTDSAHDEALTLATAFLAAGATGVVGARWPIVDVTTTLFVIMFHHYLTRGYEDPAVALRATQLWMLDPRRRVPPSVPARLARIARRCRLDEAGNWAAFTYQGR
ncbi:CHAT domain-containing protein [Lentzea sp. NPDC003310]|uniref:CHAT domain-containing protein n=1 Tax=Lentzea sp. NPDC003310 TaxID=3154447 RepID=UPI0033B26BD9